ncbi:MAG TPA: prepilin-type N-terminal cleavage/methylation domain-containing protein, partial [Deferrisomatales bacterium]|nr:prepilin-type N-terminal cleavage/methylation domain-containing protein [Deferrisomatales bacterium]
MRRQVRRGFTIVELLVSLSIAAILLTLVYQVFISQRRTYTAQEEVAEMQQNARIGLETLTRDLQNIGAGVDRGDPQLLHCAPYEIVFYADLDLDQDGVTGPASPSIAITLLSPSGGSVTTPATAPGSATAETYQIALRANAGGTYDLVREKRWGGNSVISEVVLDLNITTDGTDTVPLFRYWGDFDPADDAPDLWGDSDGDNDLSAAEIALLTPVTPGAGQTLEDIVQRVEVQLVAETRNPDQLTGGKRRNVLRSNVVPRNLWPCPAFGMAPVVPPLTVDDLFSATPTTAVDFAVTYQNQPDIDRRVFFTLANTNAPVVDSTSTAISPVFTVAPDGIATTTITWAAACAAVAAHFNGGGGSLTYDLTATLAPFVSPFGTCPASSQTVPITVGPGVADRIEVVIASDQVSTCGAQDGFEFTATGWDDMGACPTASSIQVPPVPPVDFDALTNGGGTGAITDNGVLDLASETFTVTRPTGGNYGALSGDYFPFYLTATPTSPPDITYTGGARPFPPATDANAVDILPWPPFKLEWTPSAILGPFEDCDEITYSDSFRVQDCYTNYVFNDLAPKPAGFTEDNYQVIAALVPDPNPNAPADQGGISSNPGFPTPAATVTITKPVGGTPPEYDVSYTTPVCSLDPSRVPAGINPEIELTLSGDDTPGFGPPVSPAPDAMQLDSCLDSCAIEASIDGGITWQNPLVITECDTPTTAIIRINSCNLDGKDVELVLTATGGTAQFVGGTSPTTATVALLGSSPSQGTAEVEILTATHGAQFSIEAFYPAQTGAVWSCGPLTIEVQNECTDIAAYYYDEHGMRYDLGPSASTRPCVAEIDDLYFEVDDCRLNSGRVYADIGTSKGLIVKVYAGGILYDQEEVDLDPNATLQTLTEVAPLHVAMQDGGPFVAIGPDKELNYPPGSIVTFEIQYTDPDDPSDDGCTLTERMPPPLPVCFPNAITSGGGAGWNGNFNVHWGDAVVRGNISLPSAFISKEDPAVAPINGASFAGKSSLKDQFVDIYVGKQLPFDPLTGNFTGEPNPDPATMDQPFIGKGYGNYFRNISYDKITDMIVEIDYETMKFLAQGRNVYWYTLPSGDVRNPVTGA